MIYRFFTSHVRQKETLVSQSFSNIFFQLSFRKCSRRYETEILLNGQHFGDYLDEYLLLIKQDFCYFDVSISEG